MPSTSRRYARGRKAWGISQRSGFRTYARRLVRDGQYGTLVLPEEWDPEHPQSKPLMEISDVIAIQNPSPEVTKFGSVILNLPETNITTFEPEQPINVTWSVGSLRVLP